MGTTLWWAYFHVMGINFYFGTTDFSWGLPSGKRLHNYGQYDNHHFIAG